MMNILVLSIVAHLFYLSTLCISQWTTVCTSKLYRLQNLRAWQGWLQHYWKHWYFYCQIFIAGFQYLSNITRIKNVTLVQQFKCFKNITVSFQFWCSDCKIILCSEKLYVTAQQQLMINAIISIQLRNLGIKKQKRNGCNLGWTHVIACITYDGYHSKIQFIKMLSSWKDIIHL